MATSRPVWSKSSIQRLGRRLVESSPPQPEFVAELHQLLAAYDEAMALVESRIIDKLGIRVTTRLKTTTSIIEKLERQGGGSLPNVQDLAGVRIVEDMDLYEQDVLAKRMIALFADGSKLPKIRDRRSEPSHGYRALHVVLFVSNRPVEVQIRTVMQHRWANMFEKLADIVGRGIRYGEPADDWSYGLGGGLFSVLENAVTDNIGIGWLRDLVLTVPPAIESMIKSAQQTSESTGAREIIQTLLNRHAHYSAGEMLDSAALAQARQVLRESVGVYEARFVQHGEMIDAFFKARAAVMASFQKIRDSIDPIYLAYLEVVGSGDGNDAPSFMDLVERISRSNSSWLEKILAMNDDSGYRNIAQTADVDKLDSWINQNIVDKDARVRILERIASYRGAATGSIES
jgi:ppGpp synthetase/RelA/SpoT-type nucleotidyltranferase